MQTTPATCGFKMLHLMIEIAPVPFAILVIALTIVAGLGLGRLRLRGIGIGPAGILFAGIVFGHFGAQIEHDIADFAKQFGLILFVFTIGLQLGPGIVHLWRKQGLLLNALAMVIVLLGAFLVMLFAWGLGFSSSVAAGLFSGATTNTPALGAAEQASLIIAGGQGFAPEGLASAYAVAYPGGILGIIASMLVIRQLLGLDLNEERLALERSEQADDEPLERRSILVDNDHLEEISFKDLPGVEETGVRISRIRRAGEQTTHPATDETMLRSGDIVQVVGPHSGLEKLTPMMGRESEVDLMTAPADVEYRRVAVTNSHVLNRPLRELSLDHIYHATVTRIIRAGVELSARGSSRFHFGDVAHIVGDQASLARLTQYLGNSEKLLKETRFSTLFAGIALGVILGLIPVYFPGAPYPVRLGLAGGPLLVAIALSLIGSFKSLVWYVPYTANLAMRDLGIMLFLSCTGLGAGADFFATALSREGLLWILCGFVVTCVPLVVTGLMARIFWKVNYLTICGVIAGSMTDPPALTFANELTESEASSAAYAAVYPLTMLLRILAAQLIVLSQA